MRKLNNKIKYTTHEESAVLYCKRIGSAKWEPAFTCHIQTVDYIREHGFKAALGLLRVYNK